MPEVIASNAEFDRLVAAHPGQLIVVDFFADWCGPCRMVAPAFEKLAHAKPDVVFCKVNVDNSRDLAQRFGIEAMPTFHFVRDGKSVDSVRGADIGSVEKKVQLHGAPAPKPAGALPTSAAELRAELAARKIAAPASASTADLVDKLMHSMSVKEMRQVLAARNIDWRECIEKAELMALVKPLLSAL